jgi:hypothetical protein
MKQQSQLFFKFLDKDTHKVQKTKRRKIISSEGPSVTEILLFRHNQCYQFLGYSKDVCVSKQEKFLFLSQTQISNKYIVLHLAF